MVACHMAELFFLSLGEISSVGCYWNGVAHVVVEYSRKAKHTERNVEEAIVDSGMDTGGSEE